MYDTGERNGLNEIASIVTTNAHLLGSRTGLIESPFLEFEFVILGVRK